MTIRLLESIISLENGEQALGLPPRSQAWKCPERFREGRAEKRAWLKVAYRGTVTECNQAVTVDTGESTSFSQSLDTENCKVVSLADRRCPPELEPFKKIFKGHFQSQEYKNEIGYYKALAKQKSLR